MKRITLIGLIFTITPLSIFAQMVVNFSTYKDTLQVISFSYPDGDLGFDMITSTDSMLLDSIRRKLCPYSILEKEKKRKEKKEKTLKALINSPVPDFEAPDTMGFVHHPANYRGRVLILHFWNFWDFSFEKEIPFLNKLIEKYRKDGLEILSFMDIKIGDSERKKLNKESLDFTLIPNSWQFSDNFLSIGKSKPYVILIDKQGNIRHLFINHKWQFDIDKNFETAANFEEKVSMLLKE
jgi:peroxiredoxin